MPGHNSRTADKFLVRLAPGQRDKLKARAEADRQAMNDVVLTALDKHLEHGQAFDELLAILKAGARPQGGVYAMIKRQYLEELIRHSSLESDHPAMIAGRAILAIGQA